MPSSTTSREVGTVSPAIEGRLVFQAGDIDAPVITITAPAAKAYVHPSKLKLAFGATDPYSGIASVTAKLDSKAVTNGQTIDLLTLKLGTHKLTVTAKDKAGEHRSEDHHLHDRGHDVQHHDVGQPPVRRRQDQEPCRP